MSEQFVCGLKDSLQKSSSCKRVTCSAQMIILLYDFRSVFKYLRSHLQTHTQLQRPV